MKEPPGPDHAGTGRLAAAPFIGGRTGSLPRRLALTAIGIACTLAALHALLGLSYTVRDVVPDEIPSWFDMRFDYGVPSWFGFLCMLAAGVTCFGWGRAVGSASIALTGIFFTLLMIDDLCRLHERIGEAFWAALQDTGVYPWVIVLGPPFAVAGAAACRACRRHLVDDRPASIRLLSGFVCLGVALVLEVVELRTTNSGMQLRGVGLALYSQWVEEFLELIGPVLVAWSAAEAWQRETRRNIGTP